MLRSLKGARHGGFIVVTLLTLVMLGALIAPAVAGAQQTQDPKALLDKAAKTMSGVSSFHFALNNEAGSTPLFEGIDLAAAEGDVIVPDKFQADITADLKGISLTVKVIGIGSNVWITNPMGSGFQKLSNNMGPVAALLNPYDILTAAAKTIENPKIDGSEKVDGTDTTKVSGTFNFVTAATGTPTASDVEGMPSPKITLWIDSQGLVHRLQVTGKILPSDPTDATRTFDITNFNKPVKIEAPTGS